MRVYIVLRTSDNTPDYQIMSVHSSQFDADFEMARFKRMPKYSGMDFWTEEHPID